MYAEIKIGEQAVPMEANAATVFRYKQIFHQDFLSLTQNGLEDSQAAEIGTKLAFVMAMQGAKRDMSHLSEDDFYLWLEGFGTTEIIFALGDIMNLYNGNTVTTSVAKKKGAK